MPATAEFVPPEAQEEEFVPPEAKETVPPEAKEPAERTFLGLKVKTGPAPATIDPGVDVGFGPGVAPPNISPQTGQPVTEPTPPTPPAPAPKEDIGFGPGVAPPPDWQKQNIIPGVGVAPLDKPTVWKPPIELPKTTEFVPPEAAAAEQKKAPAEQGPQLPNEVTAVTHPDDTEAKGKETQVPDQAGNLQPAKYQYDDDAQAQALINQYHNKQDLLNAAQKYMAENPTDTHVQEAFTNAILKAQDDTPGAAETAWRVASAIPGVIGSIPGLVINAAKFGFSTDRIVSLVAKRAIGMEINPEDEQFLHTFLNALSEGGGQAAETVQDVWNFIGRHAPGLEGTSAEMTPWDQLKKLSPDQQRAAIQAKMGFGVDRIRTAQARESGELSPTMTDVFRRFSGHDPNTVAALAQHGLAPDPGQIQAGGLIFNPLNLAFGPADEVLAGSGLLARASGYVNDGAAIALRGANWASEHLVEPWAPRVGRAIGGRGAQAILGFTGITHLPFPLNLVAAGGLGKARQIGGAVGEAVGGLPRLWREHASGPIMDTVAAHAADIRNGTNTLLDQGPLAPLIVKTAGGITHGALMSVPFMAGAQSPEEAGQILGFGGVAGGVHAGVPAARDAAFHTLFFGDPNQPGQNFGATDYGTKYGDIGIGFDQAHNAYVQGLDPQKQQGINNLRGWLPGIEQYWMDDNDYRYAVGYLQKLHILDPGHLETRGVNIARNPATGTGLVLVNGEHSGFDVAHHEVGHSIYRMMSDEDKLAFKQAGVGTDMNAFTQRYTRNTTNGTGYNYTDLPTQTEITAKTKDYLPGLDGITQEHMNEELGAETAAAVLRGQRLDAFTRDPSRLRRLQLATGQMFNKMGFNITPDQATTILRVKPGAAQMFIMDKALRDFMGKNPVNVPSAPGGGGPRPAPRPRGRAKTGPVPGPAGGGAPMPTPPAAGGNKQPEIGGGPNGAPQAEIDKAIDALRALKAVKNRREAQELVGRATGQNADELTYNALRLQAVDRGIQPKPPPPIAEPAPPQGEPPAFPHPLERYRLMPTDELAKRAGFGDQQAKQTLVERHGADWLADAEKAYPAAARALRQHFPEEAQAHDERIKARDQAQASAAARAEAEGAPPPRKVVDKNRIEELRQQAERDVGFMPKEAEEEPSGKFRNRAERDAAVKARHLHLVMQEHNDTLAPGDSRVRLHTDPDTGRRTYTGTHFDPTDEVHQWLLSNMDPEERKFIAQAQDAIANQTSMNFNYTHAPRFGRKWLPSAQEREAEYEASPAEKRAMGESVGQVGNRTALPITVGVGADGQGLVYGMASDKILSNAVKADRAMRGKTPYGKLSRATLPNLLDDMRKVAENHRAGYKGDGSEALVPTANRRVQVNPTYAPQQIPPEHAQFVNMVLNARDPLLGPRVTKEGRMTGAGKAVEFAEANHGYTFHHLSRGQERVEVNPMRQALEKKNAFRDRELEHGYEQFRADLMRDSANPAKALRKHGLEAEEMKYAPERVYAAAGFMPKEFREGEVTPEEFIRQRNRSAHPGFLSPLAPEDLTNHRLFASRDGTIGAALSPEGDIQNVYNNSEPRIRGGGTGALVHAVEQGGRTLDCYDGALPNIYRQAGFRETGRMRFSDEHANPGWDYAKDDRPDVVFMGWGGYPEGGQERALARATSTEKSGKIHNDKSTKYYEPAEWDRAKEDSRVYARRAVAADIGGYGAGQGPEAYPPGAAPSAGPSGGLRGDSGGFAPGARTDIAGGAEQGPLPYRQGGRSIAGPGEGLREDLVEPEDGPQIPGSKVGFMPPEGPEEAPAGKKPKKKKSVWLSWGVPRDSELRRLSPEEDAVLKDMQQKAAAGIGQFPESPVGGASYANGTVDFPRAVPGEKLTKRQVAEFFDARNERLDFDNPEHQKIMAAALTHDVLSRLISNPESYAWYNRTIDAAMQELGRLNPKMLSDPVHNLIMRLSMAITSQNQKVHPNFESAYRAYLHWDRTGGVEGGLMPTDPKHFGGGTKAKAMIANFEKINELIRDHGHDGTEQILKTPMTVRQIKDKFKVKVPGELQDYKSEASMLMGPKIGSFFNNLSKLYHTLTADLWFSRTMNRMAGRMKGFSKRALAGLEDPEAEGIEGGEEEEQPEEAGLEPGEHQLGKLRDLINQGQLENSTAKQRKAILREIRAVEAFKNDPEALDWDRAMALTPTIREWAKKQHDIYAHSAGFNAKGEPVGTYGVKTDANLLSKNIDLNFKELQDNPRTGTERKNFRDIMQLVQDNLKGLGINIEHADSQAILWYLEQDIFARAKGRKAGSFSSDYLDAAHALRLKYQGHAPDEFGRVPEPEPPPSVPKTKKSRATVGAMPGGTPAEPGEPSPGAKGMPLAPPVGAIRAQQAQEQEALPGAVTELAPPPEPEVRRGIIQARTQTISPQPSQQPTPSQRPVQPQPQPSDSGVADFFRKRGDQPITDSNDPRLTTVNIGGQSWKVNRESAPSFQGFLNELAAAGAPIRSDGGWVYRQKVGAGGISEHAFGGAIDVNQEGRNEITPQFQQWMAAHPGALQAAEHKWNIYGGERFGDLGHFEWGGVPSRSHGTQRAALASADQIMRSEGPSDVQDGRREIFGFREGQDSEYPEMARLRASGDEAGIRKLATEGLIRRANEAGSAQLNDVALKTQLMSLAHMRGVSGARAILNAAGTGKLVNSGRADSLDPNAIATLNGLDRATALHRIMKARTAYDQIVHGQDYWGKYGHGLADRYGREQQFYATL